MIDGENFEQREGRVHIQMTLYRKALEEVISEARQQRPG